MLDAASSPLISALPQYERSFMDHLSIGQAYHGAMQVLCCSVQAGASQRMRITASYYPLYTRPLPSHITSVPIMLVALMEANAALSCQSTGLRQSPATTLSMAG